jgi:DNA-binding beta-propeller fold protein YncE
MLRRPVTLAALLLGTATPMLAAGTLPGCSSDSTVAEAEPTPDPGPSASASSPPPPPPIDLDESLTVPRSCAYVCPNTECEEYTTPYACPALRPWATISHEATCPAWDGTYPAATMGQCKATEPSGEALKRPGPDPQVPGAQILPDGRFIAPTGKEWAFELSDVKAGMTSGLTAVPGTPYVLTVDIGNQDHAVKAVDTSKIGQSNPVTSVVQFTSNHWLNSGIAFVPPGRAYVATAFGVVQALTFDSSTGVLALDDDHSLALPPDDKKPYTVSGLAATPDGKYLVVSPVLQRALLVFDIDPASPTYKQLVGQTDLGGAETFGVYLDPHDPTGRYAYVSMWGNARVLEVDLANPADPVVAREFHTDSDPQGVVFLDARWMAVANDLGETVSLVDRIAGTVSPMPIQYEPGFRGIDAAGLAFDEVRSRLYVLLAGIDAIGAYDVDLETNPPALVPAGRLATGWWPSGIVVEPDGSLAVTNLRGRPIGAYNEQTDIGGGNGDYNMAGSIQQIPTPSAAELQAGDAAVSKSIAVGARPGYSTLDCPSGVMDFPVPATNTEGPSPTIEHIIFIVRENKTFDSLLGDLPGLEGDPGLTMKASTAEMDRIWTNFRDLARGFTTSDNFYNLAVKSTQGHQWTTYGRTTDFCERTWAADYRPAPLCGIAPVGRPDEGSLFQWLQDHDVRYTLLGEIVGSPSKLPTDYNPWDSRYPGGPFQNIEYNDLLKGCYFAGRARVSCDIGSFVYMTLPNDHTVGVKPGKPTPETMCGLNDEATGMVVDAIAHSPIWAKSLVIITEDDPQQGGDHVDYHRTPLVVVSPWVKRNYVSKTLIDVASLHKLFAHVLGLPYPNLTVKNAGLPLDMFTSTPDFSPYSFQHRQWPLACGEQATKAEQMLTSSWDFDNVDEQPGLGAQVMRWMRGKQLEELPPRLRAAVEARNARKAAGLPPIDEDGD